ncbi:hypothetical protein TWF225_009577 [Orbilia oligospora]|uniref:Uncharacterized protein n=1 Tax=Orbilia oligospora TaxID=2813651 RepID=A0A7C8K6N5_ORBOL|nr:hypothetical protein TWF751_010813 [Orbilia oligospora]KAF3174152.1 hypothetical protein TWF225_009577 [Orbilia oligospora]KAF3249825.1 hypothetical protein TWF217_008733 [Orbilia oligospora]KAF3259362.1 hypothetical protein TWF128_004427 [Orbilia oligospora]KAF3292525.1 hypothetical protein TWF132_005577 [Orbilia oligospora]
MFRKSVASLVYGGCARARAFSTTGNDVGWRDIGVGKLGQGILLNNGFGWENILTRSWVDVALACESHHKSLAIAFVTADQNVEKDFRDGFNDQMVAIYTISIPWL